MDKREKSKTTRLADSLQVRPRQSVSLSVATTGESNTRKPLIRALCGAPLTPAWVSGVGVHRCAYMGPTCRLWAGLRERINARILLEEIVGKSASSVLRMEGEYAKRGRL